MNTLKKLKNRVIEETENSVNIAFDKEKEEIESILNIDEGKIEEIVSILKERIVG